MPEEMPDVREMPSDSEDDSGATSEVEVPEAHTRSGRHGRMRHHFKRARPKILFQRLCQAEAVITAAEEAFLSVRNKRQVVAHSAFTCTTGVTQLDSY